MAITLWLPPEPCPVKHLTLLSEFHSVTSHADAMIRRLCVVATCPKNVPITVTLADPVLGLFPRPVMKVITGALYDKTAVDVPDLVPDAVTDNRRVL